MPSFSDLNGTLAWDIGIGTGNRGKSSRASSLQILMSQTRGHTCSVLLPDIIGRLRNPLQHWSDFNVTPAKRGELLFLKGVKRHRIDISSWQRQQYTVEGPMLWLACRETLRKHYSAGTILDWASKSNHAKPTVIIGGGCLELGSFMTILMSLFTDSKCSFGDIRTFRGATRS